MAAGGVTAATGRGEASRSGDARRRSWILAGGLYVAALVVNLVVFHDTWRVLFRTWTGVATYNHGLIVPLLSLYLIVRMRSQLALLTPSPTLWGVGVTVVASLCWAIGNLAGALVIQQFAVLALVPAAAFAILGKTVFRVAAFPFLFVLVSLPVGEFLIPELISWTADFAVAALEFLGIPVFRDGPFIRIPAGDFHVVKACSGIRYMLSSLVLGTLFAYLSFRSWWRRAAILVVCVLVPIIANWLRATAIILIAHLSNMKLAGGIDHFIYGWVFFGIVMLIIFLIGSRFSDGGDLLPRLPTAIKSAPEGSKAPASRTVAVFVAFVLAAPVGVALSSSISKRATENIVPRQQIALPAAADGWLRRDEPAADWQPVFFGARLIRSAEYVDGESSVFVTTVFYDIQSEGEELVGARNSLYEPMAWWELSDGRHELFSERDAGGLQVREVTVSNGERNRLIWSWYSISGLEFAGPYMAKLAILRALLTGDGGGAHMFALAADYDHDAEGARRAMEAFLRSHFPRFRQCLHTRTGDAGGVCE